MRVVFAAVVLCLASIAPSQAADLGGGYSAYESAGAGFVVGYDFEPGTELRAYWLRPWDGRHYFPASGKLPAVGRKEVLEPAPVAVRNRSFHREWSSFPVDVIQQPPVVEAPSFWGGERVAPQALPPK